MTLFGRNRGFFEIMLQKARKMRKKLNSRQNSVNQVYKAKLVAIVQGQQIGF